MRILGIESSCDDTGLAIYDSDKGLIAEALYSQISHQPFGGIVPELASRDHVTKLVPLLSKVLNQANISHKQLDVIAYTKGPGLNGALLTGACFAKGLSYGLNIPAIGIHHLEAHILIAQLADKSLTFPFIALLVSGGHTQIIQAIDLGHYLILGETLDDAVGEAFDKTAKLIGLDYPGGAKLSALADEETPLKLRAFPRPMLNSTSLDMSFSGLKTHALITWQKSVQDQDTKKALAYAFQQAVVEVLVTKCRRSLEKTGYQQLVMAGGVSANHFLRKSMRAMTDNLKVKAYFPDKVYCTDNGAMIAYAGYLHALYNHYDKDPSVTVKSRWPLTELAY